MADSLDDFFAKKDKKRGKDKGKQVLSAEALVKELEEGSKQVEYSRKEGKTSTAIEILGLDADDADWRDFTDVDKRDYTGLKLKEMSLQDQTDDEQRRLGAEQAEPVPDSTAWKIKDDSATTNVEANSTLAKQQKAAPNATTKDGTNTTDENPSKTSSSTDDNQSDPDKTAGSEPSQEVSSSSTQETGDKPSATTKPYIPPQIRNQEFKVLEPMKLGKTPRAFGARTGPIPNLQDKKDFPSLG